mmetsp:Transcript_32337/g.86671  ORF Transcript_32337/g.86671 Transcript_32337/m.86671 type:complete len:112 (-) Transcript_32337:58-393(-)
MPLLHSSTEKVHMLFSRGVARDDLERDVHTTLLQDIQQLAKVLHGLAGGVVYSQRYFLGFAILEKKYISSTSTRSDSHQSTPRALRNDGEKAKQPSMMEIVPHPRQSIRKN